MSNYPFGYVEQYILTSFTPPMSQAERILQRATQQCLIIMHR